MTEDKARVPDVARSTYDNLNLFKVEYNKAHPKDRLKTIGSAIDKLIKIAGQCEQLMKDYRDIRDKFAAYKENYQPKIEYYEARIEALEKEVEELESKLEDVEKEDE